MGAAEFLEDSSHKQYSIHYLAIKQKRSMEQNINVS